MTDKQTLLAAIDIIGEFSEVENGKIVSSYDELIADIYQFMDDTGLLNEDDEDPD